MGKASITITGRLARDPELRTTSKGTQVCKLTLPVDTGYGDNKITTWWTATLFGKRAETAAKYSKKGDTVMVSGPPTVREYIKRDGDAAWSAELIASDFDFISTGKPKADTTPAPAPKKAATTVDYNDYGAGPDLPF